MAALAGALDHWPRLISWGTPGVAWAFGNEIEDAGIAQVAVERGVEGGFEGGGLWINATGLEVGGGDADSVISEIGAGVDPVLCGQMGCCERSNDQSKEKGFQRVDLHAYSVSFLVRGGRGAGPGLRKDSIRTIISDVEPLVVGVSG